MSTQNSAVELDSIMRHEPSDYSMRRTGKGRVKNERCSTIDLAQLAILAEIMTQVNVQCVLYENSTIEVDRLVRGLAAMTRRTSRQDDSVTVGILFGDSSTRPLLNEDEARTIEARLHAEGAAGFAYEFFTRNLGSAGGNNALARRARSDFNFVLNPDTFPSPTTLIELLNTMFVDPSIGVAEARQIPLEHPKAYDPITGDTSWASGACMLQRRSALDAVGGYDDQHFFLHVDDVDLSWRLQLAGWRIVYVPRAVVFHDKSIGLDGHPLSTPTEEYWSILGRLMLATRFGRPDVVEDTIGSIMQNGSESNRKAAIVEFLRRRDAGRVPDVLSGARQIAVFGPDEYGPRRW